MPSKLPPLFLLRGFFSPVGQPRNFSPIRRKKRPWDALCCDFSGSDGLEYLGNRSACRAGLEAEGFRLNPSSLERFL